ncbi:MAG: hypothetical protein JETCAE02_29070 [Anaerolineaceae bacterium]|jgi:hypothetical protein|nr:MAG: hypothetical protein JETCAE02_29070 [Anaerolineaceae bacterium]
MANNPVKDEEEERLAQISITEFLQMASEAKIQLIDRLAANLLKMGERHALTAAEYYRQKFTGKEKEFPDLAYEHKRLEIKYDVLKHVISALQSTLKAERIL